APLEQVREMVAGSDELRANLCVAAHLAHVSYGSARNAAGQPIPRFRITLASAVSEEACRKVNLGYLDHRTFTRAAYESDPDTLIVGGLAGSDDVSIFVTPDRGSLVKIPRTSIAKVETSAGRKSRARGALIGFAAGAAGGALAGSSAPCTSFCGGTFGSAGLI